MSKRKKTKTEKKIADLRRKLSETMPKQTLTLPTAQQSYAFHSSSNLTGANIRPSLNYSFILPDIIKTAVITLTIIFFQIVLLLLSKYQIIKLP